MEIQMRSARPDEAEALSALTLRSKGYWGEDPVVLAQMAGMLALSEDTVRDEHVVVAERAGAVLGYYQIAGPPPDGELADMFVEPDEIGTGLGRLLWEDAVKWAWEAGYTTLSWEADPNAEPFYLRMGAERTGEVEVAPGRVLPVMRVVLEARHGRPARRRRRASP